ncbi:putative Xaa-Pro aminopeptidase Fra1p [Monosporozyma servazzii]
MGAPSTGNATLSGATATAGSRLARARQQRTCGDCTCSPGLLSRQNRRSSLFMKKVESNRYPSTLLLKKRTSSILTPTNVSGERLNDQTSIYSSDSLCQTTKEINTSQRLFQLRKLMKRYELACYIVPSEDEHQSEYVALIDQKRAFISGFSGSAGVACITRDLLNFNPDQFDGKSVLSTDGRYFNQASQELDFNWSLIRQGVDKYTWQDWCIKECVEMARGLSSGTCVKIGIDPKLISYQGKLGLQKLINVANEKIVSTGNKLELCPVEDNLIDMIWDDFEIVPERPKSELIHLAEEYSGETFQSKRERLLTKLHDLDNSSSRSTERGKNLMEKTFIVVALDEICWLLNLRGSDIDYNPVFFSYCLINSKETILFTNNKLNDQIESYLKENNIQVKSYKSFWDHLKSTVTVLKNDKDTSNHNFIIPDTSSWQIVRYVEDTPFQMIHSPIDFFKSIKNTNEINNAHMAQIKDALCIIQYFAWLESQLVDKDALIDEHNAAMKLIEIRKTQKNFQGNSFETISSTGANAAIIHYSPPSEGSSMIDPSKIYLCDTGSQFLEGTTDITRTLHFTKPTREQIDNFTLVLKGNLALERTKFPVGTTGFNLDAIARQFLWSRGLDYRHGTGHGIGSFLNVHEGPIGIGYKPHLLNYPLQAGNIISNEPGYYKDGEYGIRIENDLLVKECADELQFDNTKFLEFENITMVPYCKKLINTDLLTSEEKLQINKYNKTIWNNLVQYMQPQSITYKWLKRETATI